VNRKTYDGYFAKCKICNYEKKNCRRGQTPGANQKLKSQYEIFGLKLFKTTEKDYIETYDFLKKMGYDLSESIHTQFCNRYNLTPSSPKTFLHHHSPKDLGLS
jgi:hypothetical protein